MIAKDIANLWLVNINLGDACNLSCRYCFQNGIMENGVICGDNSISPTLIEMLRDIPKYRTANEKFKIRFTGGEPLLYVDKLKLFMSHFADIKDHFKFEIVFNGTLLTQEIVDFLNEYDFEVGISNDGHNTVSTRGVNVLDNDILVDLICKIKRLHFVCVLTAVNANYGEIFKYFKHKVGDKRKDVYVSVNPVYDTGYLNDKELIAFDWDKFEVSTREFFDGITREQFLNPYTPEHYYLQRYISRFLTVYSHLDKGVNVLEHIACGADYNHISLDCSGKVLACHNCSKVLGNIEAISLEEVFNSFHTDKKLTNSDECVNCDARIICNGSCPFVPYESRVSYYCRLQKTIIYNIIKTLTRLTKGE